MQSLRTIFDNRVKKIAGFSLLPLSAAAAFCVYAAIAGLNPFEKNPENLTCDDVKCVDLEPEPVDACEKIKCAPLL